MNKLIQDIYKYCISEAYNIKNIYEDKNDFFIGKQLAYEKIIELIENNIDGKKGDH